jgi:hypothetical protein
MSRRVRFALAIVTSLVLVLALVRQIIYVQTQHAGFDPQPPGRERPLDLGLPFDSLAIASGPRRLEAWWIPAQGADSGSVLLFHGNAETISEWLKVARLLHDHHLDVMLFDYSGYGRSSGHPSVAAVIEDGVSALQAFERRAPANVRRTAAGLSLGAGVLMEAAARCPGAIEGAALLEPFSSGREAAIHLKLLPAWIAPLMPDVFDNVGIARSLGLPLVVVHSRGDRTFPVAFAREIADAARGPHRMVVLDGYQHASAYSKPTEEYWAPFIALARDGAGSW